MSVSITAIQNQNIYATVSINTGGFEAQLSDHFNISINEDQVIFDNDDNTSFGFKITEITEIKLVDENIFEITAISEKIQEDQRLQRQRMEKIKDDERREKHAKSFLKF
jgi:hypothetical protein